MKKQGTLKALGRKFHLNVLDGSERQILKDAVCRLLWDTGVLVECSAAAERYASAGAKVAKRTDGFLVKLPEWLIMDAINSAPSDVPWYGHTPADDYLPCTGQKSLLAFGQHVQIIDPQTRQVRPTTKADGDNLYRLYNHLPGVRVQLDSLAATDYDSKAMMVAHAHSLLGASGRFAFCTAASDEENKSILKMAHAVAGGEEKFKERPFITITASPISPLLLKKECTNTLAFTAEFGMMSQIVNMCLAGATGPVTLAGSVVLSIAELLAAMVYTQIVRKGAPVLLSTCSSIMDMKSGLAASGSPDTTTICSISATFLASYGFYGIFNSGVSDAKIPDAQAGYEFATNAAMMVASGYPLVFGGGALEGGLTFDYAKFLLDYECFINFNKYLNGLHWNQEDLALELMKEIGPGNSYIQHKSTFKTFREHLSQNDLFSRTSRETWQNNGSLSVAEEAYSQTLTLLANPCPQHLSDSVQAEIDDILAEHVALVGG